MSAPAVVAVKRRDFGTGFVGVARRDGAPLITCGCVGHLHADTAQACMVATAKALGLKVRQASAGVAA